MAETDFTKLEPTCAELDVKWMALRGPVDIVHPIESGYLDPLGARVRAAHLLAGDTARACSGLDACMNACCRLRRQCTMCSAGRLSAAGRAHGAGQHEQRCARMMHA